MRSFIPIVLIVCIFTLSGGCISHSDLNSTPGLDDPVNSNLHTNSSSFRNITDMSGTVVQIPACPQKVALFSGPIAQIPYILGVSDRIAATTPGMKQSLLLQEIDPSLLNLTDVRGATGEVDYEILTITGVDMVLCPPLDGQLIKKRAKIPVVVIKNTQGDSFKQIVDQVKFIGLVFNQTDKAEQYETFIHRINDFVSTRVASIPDDTRLKVFCGYDTSHMMTYGNDTFLQERLNVAGCKNAAILESPNNTVEKITPSQSEVTMEQILAWNPDVIIIDSGSPDEIYSDKRWAPINAVRNHRVYVQPQGIFKWSRPNAESAVFYSMWLAKTVYPDRFSDVNLSDILREYFKEFFNYSLNDLQIEKILRGSYSSNS
ncbi:ABC transporter substrate-binding protein [Methanospirillum lacunae]|uniref:Fe/B12 periplasmic-binding domain-containing protein n=1 Tax=Methanospirillum lacunae TaxID=668570 RepID=A0A2V2N7Q4_9EURY|nr:ABC transporter substrate-binding protein [Methanospirillum lacunae]PWR72538.1 hypothetical protein DK846_06095 [Methanospirillum lacunae]